MAPSSVGRSANKKRRRSCFTFGFYLVVCFILACTGVFILFQHQMAVSAELERKSVESEIEREKAKQKELRIKLARLNSPARVTRVAQDEIGLSEPCRVIYLKYGVDENGQRICESSCQQWKEPPLVTMPPENPQPSGEQDNSQELTRR